MKVLRSDGDHLGKHGMEHCDFLKDWLVSDFRIEEKGDTIHKFGRGPVAFSRALRRGWLHCSSIQTLRSHLPELCLFLPDFGSEDLPPHHYVLAGLDQ